MRIQVMLLWEVLWADGHLQRPLTQSGKAEPSDAVIGSLDIKVCHWALVVVKR